MSLLKINPTGQVHLDFLLLEQYGLITLMSMIEPMRIANRLNGDALFSWQCLTPTGQPVAASNGMTLNDVVHYRQPLPLRSDPGWPDNLVVVSSFNPTGQVDRPLRHWLKHLSARSVPLVSVDTAAIVLAESGVVGGRRITGHWEYFAAFRALGLDVVDSRVEMDRGLFSCAGVQAAMELMLFLIESHGGAALAAQVAEQLVVNGTRHGHESQRSPLASRRGIFHPRLARAVNLMEAGLATPLPIQQIAAQCHVSTRQLERLFQTVLQTSPSAFLLLLRLQNGQRLLMETDLSIQRIAEQCGLGSGSYFARLYRRQFGLSPSMQRQQVRHRLAAGQGL